MSEIVNAASGDVVLVAVDFSASSESALLLGARLAADSAIPLVVLHVAHDRGDRPGMYPRKQGERLLPLGEIAARRLDEFLDSVRERHPGVAVLADARKVVVPGIPETRIIEVAGKLRARTILVGSQSRSGLAKLFSGSVSEKVAQRSQIPVTVVHSHEDTLDAARSAEVRTRLAREAPLAVSH